MAIDWDNIEIIAEDENIVRLTDWSNAEIISEENEYLVKTSDSDIVNVDASDRMIIFSGQPGVDGKQGPQGVAGRVMVGTTTTLPAGSQATVTNRGSNTNAILDFGIPKGEDGEGAPVWGNIGGTLANQTDLRIALNGKANSADLGTMSSVDDAPSDSKEYVRKNGTWKESSGGGGFYFTWGNIGGTLSNQVDLQEALNAKADTSDLGDLAGKDTVDYATEITNKPTLGVLAYLNTADWYIDVANKPSTFPPSAHTHDDRYYTESETDTLLSSKANTADLGDLASKDTVDYTTEITNKPTLGSLASKNSVDYSTDITNKPTLGDLADHDTVDYQTEVTNLPTLGDLADHDTVDYSTEVTNKPTLGALSALDSIDYSGNLITNKPTLGTMAPVNDASSDTKAYGRKDGSWYDLDGRYYTETEIDTALALKAPLASPAFTGSPTAPTKSVSDDSTKLATTAFVQKHAPIYLTVNASEGTTVTKSDSRITSTMRVTSIEFGTPSNVTSSISWVTSSGSVTFTSTFIGATVINFTVQEVN